MDTPQAVVKAYDSNIQRIPQAPCQSLPSSSALNLNALRFPMCVPDFSDESPMAMCRPVHDITGFQDVWHEVSRATESDEAMLSPWRSWHANTCVLSGRGRWRR